MEREKVNGRITLTIHTQEDDAVMCAGAPLAAHYVQEWDAKNFGDHQAFLRSKEEILVKVIKALNLSKAEATAAITKLARK